MDTICSKCQLEPRCKDTWKVSLFDEDVAKLAATVTVEDGCLMMHHDRAVARENGDYSNSVLKSFGLSLRVDCSDFIPKNNA